MVKSPMEYFQAQDFSMEQQSEKDISPAERAFLKKYLGIEDASAVDSIPAATGATVMSMGDTAPAAAPVAAAPATPAASSAPTAQGAETAPEASAKADESPAAPASAPAAVAPAPAPAVAAKEEIEYEPLDELLKQQELVTLVGYFVSNDAFVIPIDVVLEVIHYEEPYKLPMAPSFMPGVVNLRGRVLPIISLPELLILEGDRKPIEPGKGLIIVCEAKGLQVGLMINRLHTMFKAPQSQINWNAEAHLGPSAELLSGLLETEEKLLGILSVDKIVDKILED